MFPIFAMLSSPGMAILQRQIRPEVHGMAVAVLLLINNLFSNVGPATVGHLDDGSAHVRG
jgi:hypothetical protein